MEDKINFLKPLIEKAEEYGKISFELFKLKALNKTTGVASTFVSRGVVVFVLIMFIVFASIGGSLWLGELLGKLYYGFFCVAGLYGIIGGILYFFMHNFIKKHVSNSIISQFLN